MNPDKLNPWLKTLGVIVIALVIAYYVGTRTGKAKNESQAEDLLKKGITKSELTYEASQYVAFAEKLHTAMFPTLGIGNDEDAIYSVFTRMKTRSDVLQTIIAFGQQREMWTWGDASLNIWINDRLKDPQIAHINDILSRNNIDYQF